MPDELTLLVVLFLLLIQILNNLSYSIFVKRMDKRLSSIEDELFGLVCDDEEL